MEGGAETGFRSAQKQAEIKRLLHFRGDKKGVVVKEVYNYEIHIKLVITKCIPSYVKTLCVRRVYAHYFNVVLYNRQVKTRKFQ